MKITVSLFLEDGDDLPAALAVYDSHTADMVGEIPGYYISEIAKTNSITGRHREVVFDIPDEKLVEIFKPIDVDVEAVAL